MNTKFAINQTDRLVDRKYRADALEMHKKTPYIIRRPKKKMVIFGLH